MRNASLFLTPYTMEPHVSDEMAAPIPTFTESLASVLERFGNANGTEAQGEKAFSLLQTAVGLLNEEARASFFAGPDTPPHISNLDELSDSLERLGNRDGTEAQANRTQDYLTASLDLMLPDEMELFHANEELVSLLQEFGEEDEE